MAELPKIVQERLKVAANAGSHPDADLLTAFAEHALPPPERGPVMEHLARCGECREVVALALPEVATARGAEVVVRGGWFRWHTLRWAALAAGVVVVASVGTFEYQQRRVTPASFQARLDDKLAMAPAPAERPVSDTAQNQPLQATPAAPERKAAPPLLAAPSSHARSKTAIRAPQFDRFAGATAGAAAGANAGYVAPAAAGKIAKKEPAKEFAYSTSDQNPLTSTTSIAKAAPGVAAPSARQTVEASSAAPAVANANATELHGQVQGAQSRPDYYAPQAEQAHVALDKDESVVGKAKEPAKVTAPAPAPATPVLTRELGPPRWTLSAAGKLQRSFDGGATWEDVNVDSASMSAEVFVAKQKPAAEAWRGDAKAARVSGPTVFRAVSANGTEVWAGGSGGGLYHSSDSGIHWARVVPAAGGTALTGDITSIQFSDAQHGRITTSNAETWTTVDGGQTWQKQ